MTPQEAREQLDAVIREQLTNAWQQGIDTVPHSMAALANPKAKAMFTTVEAAVYDYAAAIADHWRAALDREIIDSETEAGT